MIEQGFDIFIVDIVFRTVFALAACEIGSRKGRNAGLCAILGF